MEPYEADVFSASFYISEQYCVAHFGDLDEARAWLTTQQQAGVLRPHHVWQGNTVWLDEKDFRADAPQPDMAVCRRVESPALDALPPQTAPQGDVPVASIVYLLGDDYVPSNPMWGTLDAEQKQHLFAIHAWLATQRPTAGEGDALA